MEAKAAKHRLDDYAAHAVKRSKDDLEGILTSDELRIEGKGFQPLHISFVNIDAHRDHFTLLCGGEWRVHVTFDRIDFRDDSGGVRLYDLTTILEVYLVAIVLRRIVACGNVDSGLRFCVAHRKRQLRR